MPVLRAPVVLDGICRSQCESPEDWEPCREAWREGDGGTLTGGRHSQGHWQSGTEPKALKRWGGEAGSEWSPDQSLKGEEEITGQVTVTARLKGSGRGIAMRPVAAAAAAAAAV